ncbi:MAG: hypothetical protein GX901_10885 [Lentisphaerae bacterium]|nr:hypothetical protein [Lentisphaerota bacterium]
MANRKNTVDEKVEKYINDLFADVGPSQQLFDLKEELTTNIKEKVADYQSRGMEEEQAIKEAVISMGDLRGLVDDMRNIGQDTAKQAVYTSMTERVSIAGIIAGVLLILFGIFTVAMLFLMDIPRVSAAGSGIFIVAGTALITYSLLTKETSKKYAMNKIRAALYALAIGLIMFGIFSGITSGYATGEAYIAVAATMVFVLAGVGLFLFLILTGSNRYKNI